MDLPRRPYPEPVKTLYLDLLKQDAGGTVEFDTPGNIQPDDTAAEGVATEAARADHRHAIAAGSAGAITPGDAAAEGASTSFARADHKHSIAAFGTSAGTFAEGNDSRFTNLGKVWDARVVPSGLHADSDEFNDGAVAGAWSDYDHGAYVTTTEESPPNQLVHTGTHAADGTARMAGKYKAIPSNEFQFLCHVALDCDMGLGAAGTTVGVGLGVFQDAASSTADAFTTYLAMNNPNSSEVGIIVNGAWSAYNVASAGAVSRNHNATDLWLRMRISITGAVTTVHTDWSTDGYHWVEINTAGTSTGYAALHYGVMMHSNMTGRAFRLMHQHFRVWSGAGAVGYNYAVNGGFLGT